MFAPFFDVLIANHDPSLYLILGGLEKKVLSLGAPVAITCLITASAKQPHAVAIILHAAISYQRPLDGATFFLSWRFLSHRDCIYRFYPLEMRFWVATATQMHTLSLWPLTFPHSLPARIAVPRLRRYGVETNTARSCATLAACS